MAHNLGVILRKLIGIGKPREWASMRACLATSAVLWSTIVACLVAAARQAAATTGNIADQLLGMRDHLSAAPEAASSTGC